MNEPSDSQYDLLCHYKQITFYNQCYKKYLQAGEQNEVIKYYCNIAGTSVCLSFAGVAMVKILWPALQHLSIPETTTPDLTICVWDSESTGVEMVPPPCKINSFTDRGDIWGFNSNRIKTAFHWIENSVNVMDLDKKTGVFWVQSARHLPFWVSASPLRTMFHWWMEKNGCQLLHASVVGTRDGAVLITGKGGVGKSTTALACLTAGMYYLADDYVIVGLKPEPFAYSLYCTAKLNSEDVSKFPSLSGYIQNMNKLNTEKAVMYLYPDLKSQLVNKIPLKAIFLPRIAQRTETTITQGKYWEIQRAMAFTTMSQLPNVGLHTHEFISRFATKLPGFNLHPGSDLDNIPTVISEFLSKPANYHREQVQISKEEGLSQARPLISIVMPVYNGTRFIQDAINSIMAQNYPAIEIIIVDDGSTDNTREIVERLPQDIRFFSQNNEGPASARNRGIKDVSGEYIAFLDVDDLWPENNLNLLVDILTREPELQLVRGNAQLLHLDNSTGEYKFMGEPKISFPDYIGLALYRRSAFESVGLFDSSLRFGEDTDWYLRAVEKKIKMKRIDEVTLYVRRHGENMTAGKNLVELNKLRVFKKKLDRLRESKSINPD